MSMENKKLQSQVEVTELLKPEVAYVSLVKRGANRIPFRIVKTSKESLSMLNLNGLGRIFKTAEPQVPEVVALAVPTIDKGLVDKVAKALKPLGLTCITEKAEENSTLFAKTADLDIENGVTLVRLSDNSIALVSGMDEIAQSMSESAAFSPILKTEGFFHGFAVAKEAFDSAIDCSVKKSEGALSIAAVTQSYGTYVEGLTKALPESVIKADASIETILKRFNKETQEAKEKAKATQEACPEGCKQEDWDAMTEVEKESWKAKNSAKKPTRGAKQTVEPDKEPTTQEASTKTEQETVLKTLASAVQALTASISSVQAAVTEIAQKQETQAEQFSELSEGLDSVQKAVSSTVLAGATAGDNVGSTVQKADSDPRTGCFDTAFLPKW